MQTGTPISRRLLLTALPVLALGACAADPAPPPAQAIATPPPPPGPDPEPPGEPVARVEISQFTGGFIGNVSWGTGTLIYRGRRYAFRLNGLGIGGMGGARVTASGDVFDLRDPADFAGAFAQIRGGVVGGDDLMRGWLWLRNARGVRMRLRPSRSGLALQLGADGLIVRMR